MGKTDKKKDVISKRHDKSSRREATGCCENVEQTHVQPGVKSAWSENSGIFLHSNRESLSPS